MPTKRTGTRKKIKTIGHGSSSGIVPLRVTMTGGCSCQTRGSGNVRRTGGAIYLPNKGISFGAPVSIKKR